MARIFGATYQPYTYEELATPVREATIAHQKVEEDYNNNMLVVDSLRQRAMNEPDAKWSQQILQYADLLEGYAMDLARNGLTRETNRNLLNMKRGFGTTVSPVITAMSREKDLLSIIDKADPKDRMVYGKLPSIDELIANPNAMNTSYSGADAYKVAKGQGAAFAARNIELIPPQNISNWIYQYGKKTGYTKEDIASALEDPILQQVFNSIRQDYGFVNDTTLTDELKDKMNQEIFLGMMEGLVGEIDMKYADRPDNPLDLARLHGVNLDNQKKQRELDGGDDVTGLKYDLSIPMSNLTPAQELYETGRMNMIIDMANKVASGGDFNKLIGESKISYADWLTGQGYTFDLEESTNEFEPSYGHTYPTNIRDKNGKKVNMKDIKKQYENSNSVASMFDEYGLDRTPENLPILLQLYDIDTKARLMSSNYEVSNDNNARQKLMALNMLTHIMRFQDYKDGNTHLKNKEDGSPYKYNTSDWKAKNDILPFNIRLDWQDKNPLTFVVNGKELVPKSDFFGEDTYLNGSIQQYVNTQKLFKSQSELIRQDLKDTLKDIANNPYKYLELVYPNDSKYYGNQNKLLDNVDKLRIANITEAYILLANEALQGGLTNPWPGLQYSMRELISDANRYKQMVFVEIQKLFASQPKSDANEDKKFYEQLTFE